MKSIWGKVPIIFIEASIMKSFLCKLKLIEQFFIYIFWYSVAKLLYHSLYFFFCHKRQYEGNLIYSTAV